MIVQGTVHGTVTVASADDIIYGGNTNYVADGTDVLGLEATNNIYIPEWAIHAAPAAATSRSTRRSSR